MKPSTGAHELVRGKSSPCRATRLTFLHNSHILLVKDGAHGYAQTRPGLEFTRERSRGFATAELPAEKVDTIRTSGMDARDAPLDK
jgi:hypothetical protein